MSDSGFNIGARIEDEAFREIPLPFQSGRYQYFKAMRHGLLNFVKRPSPQYVADMLSVEALRKEFILCYPLSHPGLVRYTAFENSSLYEEFVDGVTLREMIDRDDERLKNPRFILSVARQLFNVLDYIHHQGILHLDIKPENLMITRIGNTLKLIDFSCASSAVSYKTAGFTPEYKAPEQGETADSCATDLYLSGKVIELLVRKGNATRKWKSFISKAIAAEPSLRFQSAEEALSALPDNTTRKIPVYFYVAAILLALCVVMYITWPDYKSSRYPKKIEPAFTLNVTPVPDTSNDNIATQPQATTLPSPAPEELTTSSAFSPKKPEEALIPSTHPASEPAPEALYPEQVYLIGNVEGNWMDPLDGIPMRGKNGIYTGTFEFTKSLRDRYSYFLLAEKLGETWDRTGTVWSNNSKNPQNSETSIAKDVDTAQCDIREDLSNPFKLSPGKYAIQFDLKNSHLTITRCSD